MGTKKKHYIICKKYLNKHKFILSSLYKFMKRNPKKKNKLKNIFTANVNNFMTLPINKIQRKTL